MNANDIISIVDHIFGWIVGIGFLTLVLGLFDKD
jgi:hypothetical protein